MSQLGLQHSADIAPCPYLSPGVVLQSVLRSAHHHRQSQLGAGSIPASLLSITALAENAMAPDCTEQANTPKEPHRSNKRTSEQGEAWPTARLRGSGPLRLAAATRCGLRLARQSSAAPTGDRIGGPRIQSPPFRSSSQALGRNRVYPSARSRESSTGQGGRKLHCRGPRPQRGTSRPVLGPPKEAQPPNHCTAAGLKGWGGGTERGTGGCAQPEVGRGAAASRDLSRAQC